MKNLSVTALLCTLLTTLLFFSTSAISVETKEITQIDVIQQDVHLNKSTLDDLVTLKGVGLQKAQAIISYREKVGDFKSVDELKNVKGIGERILKDNMKRLKI